MPMMSLEGPMKGQQDSLCPSLLVLLESGAPGYRQYGVLASGTEGEEERPLSVVPSPCVFLPVACPRREVGQFRDVLVQP